jgi:hypothetical protein
MKKLSMLSLGTLTLITTSVVNAEQIVTVPTLEGGINASVGTWYALPSADNNIIEGGIITDDNNHTTVERNDGDYGFGWQAALGYVFDETANGIELSYRGLNNDNEESAHGVINDDPSEMNHTSNYELTAFDLMLSQFIAIGDSMQMRFLGGLSYVELEQELNETALVDAGRTLHAHAQANSDFSGWGPRVGIDARYDFGQGFGIVGGGSAAYLLGEIDYNNSFFLETVNAGTNEDDHDNHSVTNLRGNLGIDYVFFFEENDLPTAGIELGYQVDYYANAIATQTDNIDTISATFSGPYLNIKGVF